MLRFSATTGPSAPALRIGTFGLTGLPFTKSQTPTPGQYYCVSEKVDSADKLYLVIESIKLDTKQGRCSTAPAPADGAGGSSMA